MKKLMVLAAVAAMLLSFALVEPANAQGGGRGFADPPPPAPRNADGRVLLGRAEPDEPGLWLGSFGGLGTFGSEQNPLSEIPWKPWAEALYVDRQAHELEPHARCQVSGITRQFQTPYGVEIVEIPELDRIYIFDVGGPHTFRTIYMDGRNHPTDWKRTGYGHSVGWWDGDTLVVETVGYDESFWLDRRGIPHTESLRTLERFTRTNFNSIRYEITFDDPATFTEPWTKSMNINWQNEQELFEYVCQQANYGHELMVGNFESVDRSTVVVP